MGQLVEVVVIDSIKLPPRQQRLKCSRRRLHAELPAAREALAAPPPAPGAPVQAASWAPTSLPCQHVSVPRAWQTNSGPGGRQRAPACCRLRNATAVCSGLAGGDCGSGPKACCPHIPTRHLQADDVVSQLAGTATRPEAPPALAPSASSRFARPGGRRGARRLARKTVGQCMQCPPSLPAASMDPHGTPVTRPDASDRSARGAAEVKCHTTDGSAAACQGWTPLRPPHCGPPPPTQHPAASSEANCPHRRHPAGCTTLRTHRSATASTQSQPARGPLAADLKPRCRTQKQHSSSRCAHHFWRF